METSEFWTQADVQVIRTRYIADQQMGVLKTLSLSQLAYFLSEYYLFTHRYNDDLAKLIERLPECELKHSLAEIHREEEGQGNPEDSHPNLYKSFLVSIGLDPQYVDQFRNKMNDDLLSDLSREIRHSSLGLSIGARGMSGECLCQIYLECLYYKFIENPEIKSRKKAIDWRFWELHVGEVDQKHREQTRQQINAHVARNPSLLADISVGHQEGLRVWDRFWSNAFSRLNNTLGFTVDRKAILSAVGEKNVVAIFEIGSLAHGGYDPLVSDIDVAVVLASSCGLSGKEASSKIAEQLKAVGGDRSDRYSVFAGTVEEINGGDPSRTRFTVFDKADLVSFGNCVFGDAKVLQLIHMPSQKSLIEDAANFAINYIFKKHFPRLFADPASYLKSEYLMLTKLLLFPARLLFTAKVRRPASNEEAVNDYLSAYDDETSKLVAWSYRLRKSKDPLADQEALNQRALLNLYLRYISFYIDELNRLELFDFGNQFQDYRSQLWELLAPET